MMADETMKPAGPYEAAASTYWSAGWRGIVPLPHRAKKNPPSGFTGSGGIDPSYADIHTWSEGREGAGNIALRMPRNVIGLDVDAYGDKLGKDTIDTAEAEHGALPATWRTTSRDDGVSGIRLYRVPEGLAWPGEIGHGTEVIQHRHRYAVVWPSVHPEGRTYRWIRPDGIVSTSVPDIDDLPFLPEAWVAAYTGGELAATVNRNSHSDMVIAKWISELEHANDPMCTRMEGAVDQMADSIAGSAHNAARDMTLRCLRLADEGHHGVFAALAAGRKMFMDDATNPDRGLLSKHRRTEAEAGREWSDVTISAGNFVTANPSGVRTCDCYGQLTGLLVDTAPAPEQTDSDDEPVPSTEAEADPQEATTRLKDGASFILDVPDAVPAIWGFDDEVYWATGEALMVVGPPGVGKTTLTGQIVRGLIGLDDAVLGMGIAPAEGRVLYLAMDRPAQIARAMRRAFNESERDVLAERLRVWEGPPPADVAKHTDLLVTLANLAGATVVIVDSLKDAAVGLTEDEIGAGYNRARQKALANGIQVLELHHLVKRGPNGAKPNTLADVYGSGWLTAGAGSVLLLWGSAGDPIVEAVHLKQPAAEVGPHRLVHDHETGTTAFFGEGNLVDIVALTGAAGSTAKDAAKVMYQTDNPSSSEVEKVRRRLDKMCSGDAPVMVREGGSRGGAVGGSKGSAAARWKVVADHSRSFTSTGLSTGANVNDVNENVNDETPGKSTISDAGVNDRGDRDRPIHGRPPLEEGGRQMVRRTPIAGGRLAYDHNTGQVIDPDTGEAQT